MFRRSEAWADKASTTAKSATGVPTLLVLLLKLSIAYLTCGPLTRGQVEEFASAYLKAKACVVSNLVLGRDDAFTENDSKGARPWTINWLSYGGVHPDSISFCNTTETLLASLQGGSRVHMSGPIEDDLEMESAAVTWFQPKDCSFRWYTSQQACQILGKFSQIYLVGDSIMRHVHHAVFMVLRDDLQYGSLPLLLDDASEYEMCQCDGQFSEHVLCRSGIASMATISDPRQAGMCSGSSAKAFALMNRDKALDPQLSYQMRWDSSLCNTLDRPVFVFISAGSHHKHDAATTITDVLEPVLAEVGQASLSCPHVQFHVAIAGLGAQSRHLDIRYPVQAREGSVQFNEKLFEFTKNRYSLFDVWNLTRNAPTSDGYHYLSDVNMVKAMYLLNYLEMIASSE